MSGIDLADSFADEAPPHRADPGAGPHARGTAREACLGDLDCLAEIRNDWERLRSLMPRPSLNSDPVRFAATVRALGDGVRPHIGAFWQGGRLTALVLGRVSTSSFALGRGAVCARVPVGRVLEVVQGGLLHDSTPGAIGWIADHLWSVVHERCARVIAINRLAVDDAAWAAVTAHRQLRRRLGPLVPQPYYWATVPATGFEGFMARHSGKTRRTLRREGKRLAEAARGGLRVTCLDRTDDAAEVLRSGAALVARTFHANVGTPFRSDTLWRTLVESEAARGGMRGYFLADGPEPIAFVLATRQNERLYLEAIAHAPEWSRFSPGKRLLLEVIERESKTGVRLVDFGHGEAEYKRLFCDHVEITQSITIFGPGLRGRSARLVDGVLRTVDSATRSAVAWSNSQRLVRRLWKRAKTTATPGDSIETEPEDSGHSSSTGVQPTNEADAGRGP